jgi:hypothetical protein
MYKYEVKTMLWHSKYMTIGMFTARCFSQATPCFRHRQTPATPSTTSFAHLLVVWWRWTPSRGNRRVRWMARLTQTFGSAVIVPTVRVGHCDGLTGMNVCDGHQHTCMSVWNLSKLC